MMESTEYTIADVAREAGVSVSTVSRILNGKTDVAQATRERVQRVIEELGYSPHAGAVSLRAGKAKSIAMHFPLKYPSNIPYNPLDMDFIVGGAAAAGDQSFFFNLLTTPLTRTSLIDLYRGAQADGTVLMQVHLKDWRVELLRQRDYPFVMIGRCGDNDGISYVDVDFEGVVTTAFDHLIRLGHRHIAFLGHPRDLHESGYGPAMRSWQGYERALQAHAITSPYREASFTGSEVYHATLELLDDDSKLTAIVTTHAYAALHIIQALNARGRRIPEDCSVIALTASRIAELSTPALTNINFPSYDMGYKAVDILIRTLKGELTQPEQILLPPELVTRNSTSSANGKVS